MRGRTTLVREKILAKCIGKTVNVAEIAELIVSDLLRTKEYLALNGNRARAILDIRRALATLKADNKAVFQGVTNTGKWTIGELAKAA